MEFQTESFPFFEIKTFFIPLVEGVKAREIEPIGKRYIGLLSKKKQNFNVISALKYSDSDQSQHVKF
jgi:hypothetical protein